MLAQTLRDIEVLVVDGGSTDATARMAREIDDPQVRVLPQREPTFAGARMARLRATAGPYVGFLDANDY
ncbi:MAG: glycosyltransferase [Actinomycetota bacterium]|nr:glycosyltransferase [Actinomycetota bacterium]